tara:strand:- start:683 stop:898 length:216 start_codon:yes stop_codon:yes gene_type:complete
MKQIQKGSLVRTKHDIDIGGRTGEVLGEIKLGTLGIIIDVKVTNKLRGLCVAFSSGGTWWLTKDELEILSE